MTPHDDGPGDAARRAGARKPGPTGDPGTEANRKPGPTGDPDAEPPGKDGHPDSGLDELRRRILEVDEALVRLVGERRDLVLEIGRLKAAEGLPVLDPAREAEVVRRAARLAREEGVDEELVRDVVWRIVASARQAQEGRSSWGPPDPPDPPSGPANG